MKSLFSVEGDLFAGDGVPGAVDLYAENLGGIFLGFVTVLVFAYQNDDFSLIDVLGIKFVNVGQLLEDFCYLFVVVIFALFSALDLNVDDIVFVNLCSACA